MRIRTYIAYLAYVSVILLLCVSVLTYGIFYTKQGTHLALRLLKHYHIIALDIEQLQGHLGGNFTIKRLHYQKGSLHLSMTHLDMRGTLLGELLHFTKKPLQLKVEQLTLRHEQIEEPLLKGTMKITGHFNNYRLSLQALQKQTTTGSSTSPNWKLQGQGNSRQITLNLRKTDHNEHINLHSQLTWKPKLQCQLTASGHYHQRNLEGKLKLNQSGQLTTQWTLGKAHFKADTDIRKKDQFKEHLLPLTWQLHIPNLNAIYPHLTGYLDSKGYFKPNQPFASQLQLTGHHIHLYTNSNHPFLLIQKIEGSLNKNKNSNQGLLNGKWQLQDVKYQQYNLNNLEVSLTGKLQDDALPLELLLKTRFKLPNRHTYKLTTKLQGILEHHNNLQWNGTLKQFDLSLPNQKVLKLRKATHHQLNNRAWQLDRACWDIQYAQKDVPHLCLQGSGKWQRSSQFSLQTSPIPLLLINEQLPRNPYIQDLKGMLQINLQSQQKKKKQMLTGSLQLKQVEATIPILNLHPQITDAHITSKGHTMHYQAKVHSGSGQMQLEGSGRWKQFSNFTSQGTIKGSNLLISNTPHYELTATPELSFNIRPNLLHLRGKIRLPKASINLQDLSQVVILPDETQFITPSITQEDQTYWKIDQNITIALGDQVKLSLLGIKGYLDGKVELRQSPEKTMIALGELSIRDGAYHAYGQDLTIENGLLSFPNSPVTNPLLHISATREIKLSQNNDNAKSLKIGIRVTGALNRLKTELFSDTSMSDADILSYIIFGQPQHSNNAQSLLLRLLSGLQLKNKGSANIKDNLKDALGLSVLNIETHSRSTGYTKDPGSSDQTATDMVVNLVLGKHLSPNLYLHYTLGESQSFNIRYTLSNNWVLQTQTSTNNTSSVDLFYHIEY